MQRVPSTMVRVVGSALAFGLALEASAAIKTWDGGAGTLSWNDANNWSPDGVPGAGDDVVIDVIGSTVTIAVPSGTANCSTLSSNEG